MCDVVSRNDEEGLGGIIFWLDAVCRMVLLEVEQAACKKSRLQLSQLGSRHAG
jgi:hypothetical protein